MSEELRERANPNYKERLEAKKERCEELAEKREREATATMEHASKMASAIPFGQPILVGHHSEKADRRYRARIDATMSKACEMLDKAKYYESKAQTIGTGGVQTDDPEALIKLKAKLERLEKRRETYKAVNKLAKKVGIEKALIEHKENLRPRDISTVTHRHGMSDFSGWPLSNLGAKIRATKKRIEQIEAMDKMDVVDFEIGGIEVKEEEGRFNIYFPGKPNEATRKAIKGYGMAFKRSRYNGCWTRKKSANTNQYFIEDLKNVLKKAELE